MVEEGPEAYRDQSCVVIEFVGFSLPNGMAGGYSRKFLQKNVPKQPVGDSNGV